MPGRDTHQGVNSPAPNLFTGITVASGQLASDYDFGELGIRSQFVASFLNQRALFASSIVTGELGGQADPTGTVNLQQGTVWISFDGGWQGSRHHPGQLQQ